MGWWSAIYKTAANDWVFEELKPNQVPEPVPQNDVPLETYLTVTLKSMRVVNVRKGLKKFYGVVHSFAAVPHASGDMAQFNKVVSPDQLKELDAEHVDRVIQVDQPLVGPIPYRGGNVELEVGLFSVASSDLAGPYISLLTDISVKAGVSFIGVALPFVEPLKQGIQLLTGSKANADLEIGVATNRTPRTGWWVVIRAKKGSITVGDLKVTPNYYRLVQPDGSFVKDYPYMVFSITSAEERKDWFLIPVLKEPYAKLNADLQKGNFNEVKTSLKVFQRASETCLDLTYEDGKKVAALVVKRTNDMLQRAKMRRQTEELPELSELPLYAARSAD